MAFINKIRSLIQRSIKDENKKAEALHKLEVEEKEIFRTYTDLENKFGSKEADAIILKALS